MNDKWIEQANQQIKSLELSLAKVKKVLSTEISTQTITKSQKANLTKGYQGITKIHGNSETPIKKPRGGKLTKEQKQYNRQLNRLRIAIEHINRRLKIFKFLSY